MLRRNKSDNRENQIWLSEKFDFVVRKIRIFLVIKC